MMRRGDGIPWIDATVRRRVRNFERVLNAFYPTVTDRRLTRWHRARCCKAASAWRYALKWYARAVRAARAAAAHALPASGNDRASDSVRMPADADAYAAVGGHLSGGRAQPADADRAGRRRAAARRGVRATRALDVGTGSGRYLPLLASTGASRRRRRSTCRCAMLARSAGRRRVCADACRLPFRARHVRPGQRVADGRRRRRISRSGRARWRACSRPAVTRSTRTFTRRGPARLEPHVPRR